jgi:hypothetical protein
LESARTLAKPHINHRHKAAGQCYAPSLPCGISLFNSKEKAMPQQRRTIAQRVNDYLAEPPGEQFVNGKWRFWFLAVAFLSVVNSVLTWLIFKDDGENYSGPIMLSVGALVAWLCVGALHYSDSTDRRLARGVSAIDSIALLFAVVHFSGLLYVYGHHRTLKSAEAKYEQQVTKFNEDARQIQDANVKIAESARQITTETTKAEKLRNDTAYQNRKAAEAGGRALRTSPAAAVAPGLSTSAIELERPTKPAESSTAFLTKWDWAVRLANCGELLLACLTLILIRNVSARSNSPVQTAPILPGVRSRTPVPVAPFAQTHASSAVSFSSQQTQTQTQTHASFNPEGLRILRETLRDIAFHLHGMSFKTDVRGNAVWIRTMEANRGTQQTVATAKAKLEILDDAMTMTPADYRQRVERFLRQNGFGI